LQEVQAQTIEQVIAANLRALREEEALTLAQCADVFTFLFGETFSESKLSRWETGNYHFRLDDLHYLARIYGVSVLGLFTPLDDKVTHIRVGDDLYPVERYKYDFFIDPRGAFLDRATNIAERAKEGNRTVQAALDDLDRRLGTKAGLADLHSTLKGFGALERYAEEIEDNRKALEQLAKELQEAIHEEERNDDGVNREEPQ
jgi:transcriptional regulator with XRE-family HTH domain